MSVQSVGTGLRIIFAAILLALPIFFLMILITRSLSIAIIITLLIVLSIIAYGVLVLAGEVRVKDTQEINIINESQKTEIQKTETTEYFLKCPKCGAKNPQDNKYCSKCGKKITQQDSKCPKCSALNKKNAKYCSSCGELLQGKEEISQEISYKKDSKTTNTNMWGIIGIILVAIIIIALIIYYHHNITERIIILFNL